MRTSRIAAAAALTALAALPALAPGQGNRPPRDGAGITLDLRRATVIFGDAVTLDGRLSGGATDRDVVVRLEADDTRPFGDRYRDTGLTTRTNPSGRFTLDAKPARNTQYRVAAGSSPPVTSEGRIALVSIKVGLTISDPTPRRGARVLLRGRVAPAHDRRRALIQRATRTGAFRTVARTVLRPARGDRSRFRRRIRIRRDGVYRVRVPADRDHVDGLSGTRKIDVGR